MKALKLVTCTDFDGREIVFPDGSRLTSKKFFLQHIGGAKAVGEQAVALWALGLKINALTDDATSVELEDAEVDLLQKTFRNQDQTIYTGIVHAQIEKAFTEAKTIIPVKA